MLKSIKAGLDSFYWSIIEICGENVNDADFIKKLLSNNVTRILSITSQIYKKDIPIPHDRICSGCTMKTLPFGNINDENMKLTNHGLSDDSIDFVVDTCPSFSIKSLLDQMPVQKIDTDQFMSNTIHSKYYTTSDFLSAKFSTQ